MQTNVLPKNTLQLIQDAAARGQTKTKKGEHIIPVLRSLHQLPACQRIELKVMLLVYKSLSGLGPKHISDCLLTYELSRPLRSSGRGAANCSQSGNLTCKQHLVIEHHRAVTNFQRILDLHQL